MTQAKLEGIATKIHEHMHKGEIPKLDIPTRNKNNLILANDEDIWVYGDRTSTRSGKQVDGARKLLKMAYTIEFLERQLDEEKSSTLRELYYVSESWDVEQAHFSDQDESNNVIEDLEILANTTREAFNVHPEESGASLLGPLTIEEETRNGTREMHLQNDIGKSGYTIPHNPQDLEFLDHGMDFVLAVETGGMRDRLVENGFDETYNALILHTKGQPARASRRVIKRINDELNVPILVFCDGDPWSYRIFSAIAYGSAQSAHLSDILVTPDAEYLGVEPRDIRDYDLPADPLSDRDINALQNLLEDPRFQSDYWEDQIKLQLELDKKAEQQSLASYGLDFVTETYLPEKLEDLGFN